MDEWRKQKNRTECAFDGSDYLQLLVATSGGTAFHLVKQFETEKYGYAAWGVFVHWYNRSIMKSEMADVICTKLENYRFGNSNSASQYIDSFLISFREINEIPGEALSESHAISLFLWGITDPN
eukprot:2117692-Ditylum_brightwellii.AAC.1